MFYGDLAEKAVVPIPDVEPEAFHILIKYLYCEESLGLTLENAMDTLYCAKKYAVRRLLKQCRHFLQENLTPEEAFTIHAKAVIWDEPKTAELAMCTLSSQTGKFFSSPSFMELPEKLLKKFLDSDELSVSENEIYQAVRKWVVKHTENNPDYGNEFKRVFSRLIYGIRLPVMKPTEIANGPAEDGILTPAELIDLYTYKFAENKPAIPFPAEERTARPEPIYVSMDLIAHFGEESEELKGGTEFDEYIFGRIRLEVRCDVAPLASKCFIFLCTDDRKFTLRYGDVEFDRRGADDDPMPEDCPKTFPLENRLLANLPGMVSFVICEEDAAPRVCELQICHDDKTANKETYGMVFAKVVSGMETLKAVDSFRDPVWNRECGHPFTESMPAVFFYFGNVSVEAESEYEQEEEL
ncbi:putative BTB/POZ domain-containing protein 6 [Hypsibius exemplaris]|uniref:BTB/POZ domain-containing protein 6 n=1 Tax=Hypsibius exemplaris TaxID=2072580 RepID=A0A1W0WS57_HYPEX|nr:putative BTB/POZ domain-containing protein 6 [Hypsibius exemplaris]